MAANKLVFKKIRAKNFRSVGNMPLELDYQASPSTLIASEANGSGKSTLAIWALFFVLFGEPYSKDCKIAGLVNSKSNKDCLVELEFATLGSEWLLRRGYKPAIFEIYQDGKLIENEAAKNDMQKYLQSIIGMDKKAFSNIVALGVERFVPFVQMSAPERRSFVEQMLDLIVISNMNSLTKDKVKAIRKIIEQINYEVGILESKYSGHKRTLTILEDKKQQRLSETGSELQSLEVERDKLVHMINSATARISEINEPYDAEAVPRLHKIQKMIEKFEDRLSDIGKGANSIAVMHDCPTCKQGVTEEHKSLIREAASLEAGKLREPLQKLKDERLKLTALIESNNAIAEAAAKVTALKVKMQNKLESTEAMISGIKSKMVDSGEDALIQVEKDAIDRYATEIDLAGINLQAQTKLEEEHLQLLQVLKDDGIKASIVSQYIPFLNQAINRILDQLNLYVQIQVDSEFNVSMFSPDRRGQTIGNLSTGQLRRIDIAVLLAWREIAKNKASVDCNVLILDEILENLSASGVEEFMSMWESLDSDTNLLVITQRASEFDQYFDRRIEYKLQNDMTVAI